MKPSYLIIGLVCFLVMGAGILFSLGTPSMQPQPCDEAMALYIDNDVDALLERAQTGGACAQSYLADYYLEKFPDDDQRKQQAYDLHLEAAKSGLDLAQLNLGQYILAGFYPLGLQEALKWIERAAKNDYLVAQATLAMLILRESPENYTKEDGYQWLNTACASGFDIELETYKEFVKKPEQDEMKKNLPNCKQLLEDLVSGLSVIPPKNNKSQK